jgi:hypothetical protein
MTSILDETYDMIERTGFDKTKITKKFAITLIVIFLGLSGSVLNIWLIGFGFIETVAAKRLAVFLLFGSISVFFISLIGFAIVVLETMTIARIKELVCRQEADEANEELVKATQRLSNLMSDPEAGKEIIEVVLDVTDRGRIKDPDLASLGKRIKNVFLSLISKKHEEIEPLFNKRSYR